MSEKSSVWSDEEPIEKENNKNKLKNKKMSKTPADKGKKRVQKEEEKKDTGKTGSGSIEVMLAQSYDPDKHDPSGWFMSEKLDGIRCYWNGSCMYSRVGNIINAPKEWKEKLPKIALDGELWSSRDDF